MFAVLPLSLVDRSIWIIVRSLSFHLVLLPLSFVELFADDAGSDVLDCKHAVAVFLLHSLEEMPMAFVKCTSRVVESAVALKFVRRNFGDDFLWRLLDHFFLYLFLWTHPCEFIIIETYAGVKSYPTSHLISKANVYVFIELSVNQW